MKKTATIIAVLLVALFGISGTAFAKHHHHRRHKKGADASQTHNAASTAGNAAAGVTGPADGAPKTN